MHELEVVCFSYNRWRLLDNLVSSVREAIPGAAISIVDDGSDDPETISYLASLKHASGITVVQPGASLRSRHGGLHHNMQWYFANYCNARTVIYVQDDTQVVRRLTNDDLAFIDSYFDEFPDSGFLYPMFRRYNPHLMSSPHYLASGEPLWFRSSERDYAGFSDICVFRPQRLKARSFEFASSELEIAKRAFDAFGPMGEMPLPFVAYVPAPRSYRFKQETLTYRFWHRTNTGCYPINMMRDEEVQRMKACFPGGYPLVSDFLSSPTYPHGHPWPVFRMQYAPKFLKQLDQWEQRAVRMLAALTASHPGERRAR